ncbi:MAG: Flp pilus assembly protein CpaB, partial [Oricola sp.]
LKSNVKTVVETVEVHDGAGPGIEFATIVVAAEPMRYGTLIDPGMLKELPWPKDDLPKGAFSTIDDLLTTGERVALAAIDANEPILVSKVTDPNDIATLSRRIEDGMRAVTIRVDDITGVAGFVVPGDRVDIQLTRTFTIKGKEGDTEGDVAPIEISPAGDRTYTGSADAFVATAIVLADVKVLSIDQIADERQSAPVIVRAVTLEVDAFGAKALASAQSAGTLSLQLRRAGDVAEDDNFKMPLHGLDESMTSAFEIDPGSSTAKVTVHRKAEVETYDVRDEGAVK